MTDSIPANMRNARQWLLWRAIPQEGKKPRKVPFYVSGTPRNGATDTPEDLAQLATYDDATRALQSGQYTGLGFALNNGWQGIDLDGVSERPLLQPLMTELCGITYCETSPSGDGIHAIGYGGQFYPIGSGGHGFEAYSDGRYFTVTGAALNNLPTQDLSSYVETRLRPIRGVPAPTAAPAREYEERTDADLTELRDALRHIPADDRDVWVAMGNALCRLGDDGFALWMEWSATSDKHDPVADISQWESFSGDRTGFAAVFARAQSYGWVNPKARKPLDTAGLGFGGALPAVQGAHAPTPRAIEGSRLVMAHQAADVFKGCVYVESAAQILVPGGDLLDQQRFNNRFKRYGFMIDPGNTVKAKTPWDAFLSNQVFDFPYVQDQCFRPDLPPAHILENAGRVYVNTWWPINTIRTEGDVTPFLTHLAKLLPDDHDREVLTSYLAAMIQYPGIKFRWAPVVQGTKGNGKTIISTCIEYALGMKYCHRPNAADISSKFTGWMANKLCVSVSEIATHDKREVLEFLKTLISDDLVEIQKKGNDQYTGENTANFLMFVNPKNAIPVDDDERRYAILFTAQQSAADIRRDGMGGDYFPNLIKWMKAGGYAHIAHYLSTYPIPDHLNPATECHRAPRTTSTSEAITASLGMLEQEILEAIECGEMGFRGGVVSSIMLAKRFEKRNASHNRLRDALHHLGYVKHPALPDGRVTQVVHMPDNGRPRLFVRAGSAEAALDAASVVATYIKAQLGGN